MSLINQIYKQFFKWSTKLPKKEIIIFESFGGSQYSDNPKALYEYAKQQHPNYELYWHVRKDEQAKFKKYNVPFFTTPSIKELTKQARAKIWIVNARTPKWKIPETNTIMLQTWHGTPLKKLGLDIEDVAMPGVTTDQYYIDILEDVAKWDYLVAQNDYSKSIFKSAFKVTDDQVLLTGYPRNDKLFNTSDEEILQLKKSLKLPLDKKIILYAPTWRDTQNRGPGKYYLDFNLDLDLFKEKFPDSILLIRTHYLISEKLNINNNEQIYNMSDYPDVADLYLVSDALITDYSSVFFDYANLNRPIIFYAYDYDEYKNKMRDFYFDYNEVPGPIVQNNYDLMEELADLMTNFQGLDQDFLDKYCKLDDGHASERIFNFLLSKGDDTQDG